MKRKRRNHLPRFKAKVALAAIKNDKTLAELAEQFDVHQNQISEWKKQLLEQADTVFGSTQEHKAADESQLRDLHAKIGELALENDKNHGIKIRMDGKGRWIDNVFIERLWRSLKYEEVYLKAYDTSLDARL